MKTLRILALTAITITMGCLVWIAWPEAHEAILRRHYSQLNASRTPNKLLRNPLLDGTTGGAAYEAALTALLAAQYRLTKEQEVLVASNTLLAEAERKEIPIARDAARKLVAAVSQRVALATSAVTIATAAAVRASHRAGTGGDGSTGASLEPQTLLVMFHDFAKPAEIDFVLKEHRLKVVSGVARLSLFVVQTTDQPPPQSTQDGKASRRLDPKTALDGVALAEATFLYARVQRLRECPIVEAATVNVPLRGTIVPPANIDTSTSWFTANNEPLVNSRFPQAWNFRKSIERKQNGEKVAVGVLDEGFLVKQDDLSPIERANCGRAVILHGTQVASIIGAHMADGHGMDGAAAPFVRVVGCACDAPVFDNASRMLDALLTQKPPVRIINVSMGYNWSNSPNADAKDNVKAQGLMIRKALKDHPEVVIISAAGNGCKHCREKAIWSSPFNWAALGPNDPEFPRLQNVIVVEALNARGDDLSTVSNIGGTLGAIGENVLAASGPATYARSFGTSAATPLVTATVAMMIAVNPNITVAEIMTNLGVGKSGRSNAAHLDAFDAVRRSDPTANADLADLDNDGRVDESDFEIFKRGFKEIRDHMFVDDLNEDNQKNANDTKFCRIDLNGDGLVTEADLQVMIDAWQGSKADLPTIQKLNQ
jgi:subtilisin family serine protease